ncbi:LRR receptor-like serine/threonine-protein kinase ER1 isoform X2 [Coffea arabica]|uniref:LRR receptor-like serine/threonine-protein kinase ER1 isoform X2 n=1 Tax=Coffea arabica TaxID=13443 RepID=A0ABM4VG90_COFAR
MGSSQAAVSFLTNIARAAFGLGIGAIILNSSLYIVDGGQRAVLFNQFRGVIDDTIGEGRNFSRFPPDSFIGNPLLRGNWLGSISSLGTSKFKAIFSRTAVVCLILGFMMLLSMATLELGKLCLQKL